MGVAFSQIFPPGPTFTEKNISSQKGRVFIVTGGYSGIGYNLASILYRAGGKVYIAGRSEEKARACIEEITKASVEDSTTTQELVGQLEYLPLELDDLNNVRTAAEAFKKRETRLDVLVCVTSEAIGPRTKYIPRYLLTLYPVQ